MFIFFYSFEIKSARKKVDLEIEEKNKQKTIWIAQNLKFLTQTIPKQYLLSQNYSHVLYFLILTFIPLNLISESKPETFIDCRGNCLSYGVCVGVCTKNTRYGPCIVYLVFRVQHDSLCVWYPHHMVVKSCCGQPDPSGQLVVEQRQFGDKSLSLLLFGGQGG